MVAKIIPQRLRAHSYEELLKVFRTRVLGT
jgi:hypothetical protein